MSTVGMGQFSYGIIDLEEELRLRQFSLGTYEYQAEYGSFYFTPKTEYSMDSFMFSVKYVHKYRVHPKNKWDCEAIENERIRTEACIAELFARKYPGNR